MTVRQNRNRFRGNFYCFWCISSSKPSPLVSALYLYSEQYDFLF